MSAAITVENLAKRYGPVEALAGIGFSVGPGEIFGLLGVNGAGKTTALECISGLREPDGGRIEIGGVDAVKQQRVARTKIGVVLPTLSLNEQITPTEALRLFGAWRGDQRAAHEWLEQFGLAAQANARVSGLSQGQRQRLNLALACLGNPVVMLLDEPSNNLDPQARHELHEEIRRMKEQGRAVLLATHLLDEAEKLCDRVAILDRGRILAEGAPRELADRLGRRQRVRIETDREVQAVHAGAWTEGGEVEDWSVEENVISFSAESGARALVEILSRLAKEGVGVRNVEVRQATLEETFLRLTGKKSGGEPRMDTKGQQSAAGGEKGNQK